MSAPNVEKQRRVEMFFEVPQDLPEFTLEMTWRADGDTSMAIESKDASFEVGRRSVQ